MNMCNNKFVIICFDFNSQTSEPIRNLKSLAVDLVGEDLEVEEHEGTEEEGEQELTNEDLDTTNEDLDTSKKRKTTSDVWAHFTRKKVDEKVKAQCHYCNKLYLSESSQGTTHLHNHLARCPQMKFKDIRKICNNKS